MAWVITTQQPGATFGNTGKWFFTDPEGSVFPEVSLPSGVNAVNERPSFADYNADGKSRLYGVGGWTDNVVFTENYSLARQGILPPTNPIINSAGAGNAIGLVASGTGITANVVGYITWWDDVNQRRSPLSGPSPIIALTNQGLSWTNLPTNPRDGTVTHIELWRAVDGNSPRFVCRRDLGTTAVVENVSNGNLGEALTEDFTRFQRSRWNVMWHDRQAMAGDDRHPERLYLSLLNEPERYGGFYLRTRKGESIVGLISMRDQLIVVCERSSYVVTGYTEDDIKMDILEPELGSIGHFSIAHVHNWALVPTHLGVYLCTGSAYHFVSKDFQYTWVREYADNQDAYEASWAVNDIESGVYKLFVGEHSLASGDQTYWVLDYSPLIVELGGNFAPPHLSLDVRARTDECAAILKKPGARRGALYTGSCDGTIRRENVRDDADDDGDTYQKRMSILTKHYLFDDPGGTPIEGNTFATAWMYVIAEDNAYTIKSYGGDDYANRYFTASDTDSVLAGEEADNDGNTLAPKCVEYWEPGFSGRGASFLFEMVAPKDGVEWLGHGGTRFRGNNDRAPVTDGGGA